MSKVRHGADEDAGWLLRLPRLNKSLRHPTRLTPRPMKPAGQGGGVAVGASLRDWRAADNGIPNVGRKRYFGAVHFSGGFGGGASVVILDERFRLDISMCFRLTD
jgi:hypothetical protein